MTMSNLSTIGWSRMPGISKSFAALGRRSTTAMAALGPPTFCEIAPAPASTDRVRTTIRTIITVTGTLLVAMWLVVGFSVITARQASLDAANSEAHNLMAAFRGEVAQILRAVEAEMDLIAERLRRERGNLDLYAWGKENVLVLPGMAQATIIGPNGQIQTTTQERQASSTDLSDRAHFRVHLDGKFDGLYIGPSVIGRISGVPLLPISRRVDAEDGTFLGVLAVLLSPNALTTLPKSIDLGSRGSMALSGLDDVIRARFAPDSPDGTKGIGTSIAGGPRPAVIEAGAEGRYERVAVLDGTTRLYTYGRVGSYQLVVTVGLELDRVLAGWRSLAATIIAIALGATLLLIWVAAHLIRRIFADASTARATTLAITHTAEHDFLTGLPNRMFLNDSINQAIAVAHRHNQKIAVLFLDLDGFKHINDSLGHLVGDKLLQSVSKRLVNCVRATDTVTRQGGDEFIALLRDVQQSEDIELMAQRILQTIGESYAIDENDLHITTSIGVSVYPENGLDAETLIKNADIAMYKAKGNGRHGYQFFEPAMNARAVERQSIEADLRRGLERHEFTLHYQPKVDVRTGAITGAEALIRWTHPTRGAVSPAEFIPIAEDSGLIVPIGTWVLREACVQARAWMDAGQPMTMAVNVSTVEFREHGFLEGVLAILSETGVDPQLLEIELTESVLSTRAESTASILETLSKVGVKVAIDDFGTGYSSLSYLRKFPVDTLKIDQSFVRQISIAGEDTAIVVAVIAMAHSLKLRVVAEGVETLDELNFLQAHECDEVQGYYFSRALPAEQFATLLRTGVPAFSNLARRSRVMA